MRIPLQFPKFKWRWATLTPTESLNLPFIYLGVTRALYNSRGQRANSQTLLDELEKVQQDVNSPVDLARSRERNIIRNSGQYWKATGILADTAKGGGIQLTDFGEKIATGEINRTEFALTVVRTLELPNTLIESPETVNEWNVDGVVPFKPFLLLIDVTKALGTAFGPNEAFITEEELFNVIIPLSGHNALLEKYVEVIINSRRGEISVDTVVYSEANDLRMAREFLLFLSHNEIMAQRDGKYFLSLDIDTQELVDTATGDQSPANLISVVEEFRRNGITGYVEDEQTKTRDRVLVSVADRSGQARFRKAVLGLSSSCVVTGADHSNALEAAHIIPVSLGGGDAASNGLSLRRDLHTLFDYNHIRIDASGNLHKSASLGLSTHYRTLPSRIALPAGVDLRNIDWRFRYYS